jgi:tryptophan synthase alpha chain
VAVMTYANIVTRPGSERFCDEARTAGVSGLIVPDLPVDEAAELGGVAAERGIDTVLLAAPNTAPERYAAIGRAARGFVYCVSTYGVTGARDALSGTARGVVDAMRPHTDLPLIVGVGIATPELATQACGFADGVAVGSSLMARLLEADRPGFEALARAFRSAIPSL